MPDEPTGRANSVVEPGQPSLPPGEPGESPDDSVDTVQGHDPYQPL